MPTPESIIEDYAAKLASKNGFLFYKFMSGETGVPDRILVGHGKIVFMELKAKNGKLSERQKFVSKQIYRKGGIVMVPYSKSDVEQCYADLMTLTYSEIYKKHKNQFLSSNTKS